MTFRFTLFIADWTLWTDYSECSKSCFEEPKLNPGYGYKIRGRNCEAHTDLFNTAGTAVNIQLPEKLYKGCVCATDSQSKYSYNNESLSMILHFQYEFLFLLFFRRGCNCLSDKCKYRSNSKSMYMANGYM